MTEIFKKLNYKSQRPILVLNAPASFGPELDAMRDAEIHKKPEKGQTYNFALAFAAMEKDLIKAAKDIKRFLTPDSVLWFAYPKQTSKVFKSDLNRDTCRTTLLPLGFDTVRQIAIDEDWSALRYKQNS